jgi:PAS domain S-box-containing protein
MFVPPNLVVSQLLDVTDTAREELERARLAAIVECSDDAIIGKNLEGIIESWNAGAERLYGYTAEEVIGRSIALLAPPERKHEIPHLLARLRAGERIHHVETTRLHRDGSVREVSVSMSPIRDASGRIVGAAAIARDISALNEAQRQAERARLAAAQLAQVRSDFVATTSHELRTPLTGILGFAELLRSRWGRLDDAARLRQLDRVIASAQRQKRLIDDLLLLSRMDDTPLVPHPEAVPLAALVHRAAAEVVAGYRGQRVEYDGSPEISMLADPDRLFQIVANLVDNAAKCSPEGSPITIRWAREGAAIALRVGDQGPGIPEHGRDQLFTPFGRLPGSQMRAGRVGTGLGLYLSRQLARAMHGDLWLEASGGGDTTFHLSLPAAPQPPTTATAAAARPGSPAADAPGAGTRH